MNNAQIAVIGGSGLYEMEGLTVKDEVMPETPFGTPSDSIVIGELSGQNVAFLPRHGRGHRLLPGEVPSRANIYALKLLGVRWIISVSACGSLREDYRPGDIVIPDGLFDRTRGRPTTFFGEGLVAHIGFADPFDPILGEALFQATAQTGARVHHGGNFVVIEGPRFSTKTESHLFRQWGMDIIGMTAVPEAQLAREAEIAYACMAHVTDYDVWHESEEPVSVEMVVKTLMKNVEVAQQAIRNVVPMLAGQSSPAWDSLRDAIMTNRTVIPENTRARLWLLLKKYWDET
ncbi:MAG: S-methyl-5'-thioadenosine phosphorylase [Ardenticatenaceae bacterium]|nr:S-methyl-5'-thioadenosine phosphorylase [Ardenticatenaceae bacterium]HBY97132.1 S-methyl-5'-thioadenosine phosphorylase [Chloroflexota bacterium]